MVTKWFKRGLMAVVILCLAGGFIFGTDMVSYIRSSVRSVQTTVKGAVPIEFELRRARDLLVEIIPEMHANIRLIAQEEIEVANLKTDIDRNDKVLADAGQQIQLLRKKMNLWQANYLFGEHNYSRNTVKDELSRRFEQYKESEILLKSKQRLLAAREKSLNAAMQLLEKTRSQKRLLQDKIEGLASQYRLVRAAAVGSTIRVDNSKLAQTEKLIADIKKRLDVAERVLAHESRFVQDIPLDTVNEKDLLVQIDDYFTPTGVDSDSAADKEIEQLCKVN